MTATRANDEAIEAWNTVLFDKFVKYRRVLTTGLGSHGTAALDRYPPRVGSRVVDLGCGFGDTTLDIAQRVGTDGRAVGLDAAPRFIETARAEAPALPQLSFEVADIEASVPDGPYDHAFSRMGTMFFANPMIALRNVRRALVPGGLLCMVVWRKKEANEALARAEVIAREILGDPPKGDQVTCGPGPFSMASPDLVGDVLLAGGWRDIRFDRNDADICVGNTVDDAIEFALMLGPAGEIVRLAGEAAELHRAELVAALRGALQPYLREDGVWMPSSTWIVTAHNP